MTWVKNLSLFWSSLATVRKVISAAGNYFHWNTCCMLSIRQPLADNQSQGLDCADLLSIKQLEKSNIVWVGGLKGDVALQKGKGNMGPDRWKQ